MKDNDGIRDDLSALIDGALDPDRRQEVQTAIENDPALWAEYKRLLGVNALYAALPREAAPEGFAGGVRDAIARRDNVGGEAPQKSTAKVRPFTRAVFWPLAAAATLLVGFFLWSTVNVADRSKVMLSMNKTASTEMPADAKGKDERLDKATAMPAEAAKTPAPAAAVATAPEMPAPAAAPPAAPAVEAPAQEAPAPQALPESAEIKPEGKVIVGQATPADDGLVPLETLRKGDRESASSRAMTAKSTAPEAAPATTPAEANAPASVPPAPAKAESATAESGPQAGAAAPENAAEQRKVAGRVFARSNAGWVDQAYKGEVLTPLEIDSDEYKALLPTHPPLEQVAALGGTITLRIDGVWRDLKTGKPVAEPK
jgi:hypothetical protein